jgi:hypothetical protein
MAGKVCMRTNKKVVIAIKLKVHPLPLAVIGLSVARDAFTEKTAKGAIMNQVFSILDRK